MGNMDNESDSCIIIKNLSKSFKKGLCGKVKTVVNNFNLQIQRDEIVCLIGNNGSGKTTLVNMVVGLTDISEGEAKIYGH